MSMRSGAETTFPCMYHRGLGGMGRVVLAEMEQHRYLLGRGVVANVSVHEADGVGLGVTKTVLGGVVELEMRVGIVKHRAREVEQVREKVLRLDNAVKRDARKANVVDLGLGVDGALMIDALLGLLTKLDIAVVVKARESAVGGVGAGDRLREEA